MMRTTWKKSAPRTSLVTVVAHAARLSTLLRPQQKLATNLTTMRTTMRTLWPRTTMLCRSRHKGIFKLGRESLRAVVDCAERIFSTDYSQWDGSASCFVYVAVQ